MKALLAFVAAVALVVLFTHLSTPLLPNFLDYMVNPAPTSQELWLVLWQLLCAVPAIALTTWGLSRVLPREGIRFEDHRVPLIALTMVAMASSFVLRTWVTERADFADDDRLNWYQAQVLLEGTVVGPLPPVAKVFDYEFISPTHDGTGLAGLFTVGQPLLFALGSLLGDRDLFQWLSVGALVLLVFALTKEVTARIPVALTAAAFVALSPWFLFASASRHNSIPATVFTTATLLLALRWKRTQSFGDAAGMALSLAALFLIRSFDGTLLLATLIPLSLTGERVGVRASGKQFLAASLAGLIFSLGISIQLFTNWRSTGSPFTPTYDLWLERAWPEAIRFGFGTGTWNVTQTPLSMLIKTLTALMRITQWLGGSLVFGVLALSGLGRIPSRFLLAWGALFITGYAAFLFPSIHDFGTVYHLPLLPLLAMGAALAVDWLSSRTHFARPLILASMLIGAATFIPFEVRRIHLVSTLVREPIQVVAKAQAQLDKPVLVLQRRMSAPSTRPSWVLKPPPLSPLRDEPVEWSRDDPAAIPSLHAAFPDRVLIRLIWDETGHARVALVN